MTRIRSKVSAAVLTIVPVAVVIATAAPRIRW